MTKKQKAALLAEFQAAFPLCRARPGVEFDGNENCLIWIGERSEVVVSDDPEFGKMTLSAVSYYSDSPTYIFGVHKSIYEWAKARKIHFEAYDGGTYLAWES
jgi:hypothetical protein